MTYQVFCTFDLKNASSEDYKNAYADLAAIGLSETGDARTWAPTGITRHCTPQS